jgi:hypothetical protein
MNAALPHNKLRVHYCVLQQGETATVWVAGTTAGDTVTERWPAWLSMSRTQWLPPGWKESSLSQSWCRNSAAVTQRRRTWLWIGSPCSGLGWFCRSVEHRLGFGAALAQLIQ